MDLPEKANNEEPAAQDHRWQPCLGQCSTIVRRNSSNVVWLVGDVDAHRCDHAYEKAEEGQAGVDQTPMPLFDIDDREYF